MRAALAVLVATAVVAFDAAATIQRTFVASTGNDANPCTLAAPCRGFAAAIAQTTSGGEVVVLDSAGYGTIPSISQSISITAPPGVYAGISVTSGDGITIDGASVSRVLLRGLTINGQGGNNAVTIATVSSVYIENCTIIGMATVGIDAQHGVLHVSDTVLRANGTAGVRVQGPASAHLDRVRIEGHASTGIQVMNGARVAIENSVVSINFRVSTSSATPRSSTRLRCRSRARRSESTWAALQRNRLRPARSSASTSPIRRSRETSAPRWR